MADPVRETVLAQYVSVLKTVKLATGYNTDFQRVDRFVRLDGQELPYLCVVTAEGTQADGRRPARHIYCLVDVDVLIFLRHTEELDRKMNIAVADVQKAILSDLSLRGGHNGTIAAINRTDYVSDGPEGALADADGAEEVLVHRVTFRTNYIMSDSDPYSGRGTS